MKPDLWPAGPDAPRRGTAPREREGALKPRGVTEDDLDEMVRLERLCHEAPWTPDNFLGELGREVTLARGLWLADDLAGLYFSWVIAPECHLLNLMVHPRLRGLGLGRRLMGDLERESAARGAVRFLLEVRLGNVSAQNLYASLGYKVVGFRSNYYDDGSPAVLMTLETGGRGPAAEES
ncbi:MAG: GNAT family N-acetyltransferase [Deltaproteobacteria bacterium]|nr:GNAT family N-acetyltransferase [Deltaproteobacteria bacterium]